VSKDRTTSGAATAAGGAFAGARGATGPSRLPTAPRERKPALAALAVLLILAGALATMLLVNQSGNRIQVVKVGGSSIAAGSKLTTDEFVEASVAADSSIKYVKWEQLNQLQGRTTYNTLIKNSLLTVDMLGDQSADNKVEFTSGTSLMGIQVKQGHYPTGQMFIGDKFMLYTNTVTAGTNGQSPTTSWQQVGVVTLVNRDNSDTLTATISVETEKVVAIANASDLMLIKTYS
jgi:hypothetical protein